MSAGLLLFRYRSNMISPSLLDVVVVSAVLVFFAVFSDKGQRYWRSQYKLPPGPRGVPVFGNIFQVSALRPHPQFLQWAREYGEIFHLRLGPQTMIVLNTAEAADELFMNRSKNYSGRSAPHVGHDILSDGQRIVFLPYGKEWKAARKSVQAATGPGPSKRLRHIQDLESRTLLKDLLDYGDGHGRASQFCKPTEEVPEDHWFSLFRRYATSVVMMVTYGKRAHRIHDNPQLHKIYEVVANFVNVAQPGNYLADAFPIMRKLPDCLAPWRVKAREMHLWEMELWGGLLDEHKESTLKNGVSPDCYISSYLRSREEHGHAEATGSGITEDGWMRDKFLTYVAASVLEAGSDTTSSAALAFVLFMLSSPNALKRAREEIDTVVGDHRLPDFDDQVNLPYVVACVKETLRKHPPVPMGVPHRSEQDDIYKGFFIPKGSTVIGNVWAIHMDPVRYPNPTVFDPDRFYNKGCSTSWSSGPDAHDRDHYVFGWGRRFCQGALIAEASLFMICARIIWAFNFSTPKDPDGGCSLLPDADDEDGTWSDGFVRVPKTFPVVWNARSDSKAAMIRKISDDLQLEWQSMGLEPDST